MLMESFPGVELTTPREVEGNLELPREVEDEAGDREVAAECEGEDQPARLCTMTTRVKMRML